MGGQEITLASDMKVCPLPTGGHGAAQRRSSREHVQHVTMRGPVTEPRTIQGMAERRRMIMQNRQGH